MEININHIQHLTATRYTSFGNPKTATTLLIALHGYGQLSTYFIRKFTGLDPEKYFIVCPEAPHRFYHKGSAGRVGASWMTKEDRLTDINNYILYLETLLLQLLKENTFDKKVLLGFSQGGATASRWNVMGTHAFDLFLLWAAVYPPDVHEKEDVFLKSEKNYFVVGNKDEYLSSAEAKIHFDLLNKNGLNFEFKTFDGTHDIDIKTLKTIL